MYYSFEKAYFSRFNSYARDREKDKIHMTVNMYIARHNLELCTKNIKIHVETRAMQNPKRKCEIKSKKLKIYMHP